MASVATKFGFGGGKSWQGQHFFASDTLTVPSTASSVRVIVVGGGGSGPVVMYSYASSGAVTSTLIGGTP